MDFDLSVTDHLLTTTRAVRKRLDVNRPVPREVILECLDLALQAPNGSNRQMWRWIVIDDPDLKVQIAGMYKTAAEAYFAVAGAGGAHKINPQIARIYESWRWLVENIAQVPAMVLPCVEGELASDASLERQAAFFGSIFPAIWSFQLALRSRGLGSTLTTSHLADPKASAALLGIPDGFTQVALLPVGYTIGSEFKRAERLPASAITNWNGWQNPEN